MRQLEEAHFSALGSAGKSAFYIAEQFAFQKVFRECRAVDRHKGMVFAGTGVVDALRKELFSGSGFSVDQDI